MLHVYYAYINNANKLELTPGNKTPTALASSNTQYKIEQFIFIFITGMTIISLLSVEQTNIHIIAVWSRGYVV